MVLIIISTILPNDKLSINNMFNKNYWEKTNYTFFN